MPEQSRISKLVSDMNSQRAYAVLVREFAQIAWGDYMSMPFAGPISVNDAMAALETRLRHWILQSYDRASGASPLAGC